MLSLNWIVNREDYSIAILSSTLLQARIQDEETKTYKIELKPIVLQSKMAAIAKYTIYSVMCFLSHKF